jgi:hypothetical protein
MSKIPMTLSGIKLATFWLVAQCLNQPRYVVPPLNFVAAVKCEALKTIGLLRGRPTLLCGVGHWEGSVLFKHYVLDDLVTRMSDQ